MRISTREPILFVVAALAAAGTLPIAGCAASPAREESGLDGSTSQYGYATMEVHGAR